MSGGDFIIAINLLVCGLLATAFLMLGVFGERREPAYWLAFSFVFGAVNFLLEFMLPRSGGLFLVGFGAYASFLATLAVFNVGLARLYGRAIPWRILAVFLVVGCIVRLEIEGMARDLLVRQVLYQLPYALMQGIGVMLVWRARRQVLDNLLLATLGLSTLHYLFKPIIAARIGGVGDTAGTYSSTVYAMASQSSGTVLGLGVALLLLIVLVRDILETLVSRSETDPLSSLLNRRGFEARRDEALRKQAINGLPVSLVLCDLDKFKVVNDTHGHSAGDRVIIEFARLLATCSADHHAAGRIGGEEFAVLLPGTNLATARLFAENLRTTFANTEITGFAPAERFTASFGVAEAYEGEIGAELQARADAALYAAKREGRDCVWQAPPPMPPRRALAEISN